MLKLTSHEFAETIGLAGPITTPRVVMTCFCILILIPLLVIHLKFKERVLDSEIRGSRFSFC